MSDPFEPDYYYYVFNHANGSENLFRCRENYLYFLAKYTGYIQPIAENLLLLLDAESFPSSSGKTK